jgi:haloalkane dehalogenase
MTVVADVALPQVNVLGSTMAYREAGDPEAPVALFLHGNPTSSYIWRNIIPLVAPLAHCIAPDLIGFGQSGKPDIEYRFADHVRYLDAFLDTVGISSAFVVAQDWGTALAFHLAARRPEFIRGLAFMEFIRLMPTWNDFHVDAIETFQKFRTPGVGEEMILQGNAFVEGVLPAATVRKLTDEEMSVYRAPFPTPESRRPTWRFPNELPIAGEPADVYLALEKAHHALAQSSYPKLLFVGDPGALVSPAFAASFAKGIKNCRLVQLDSGIHYLQEDHPDIIGATIKEWLIDLGVASSPKQKLTPKQRIQTDTLPALRSVLEELMQREPIFHRPELGTSRAALEDMTHPEFSEIGASGRSYSREFVLAELEKRYQHPTEDIWETSDFHCRELATDVYLLTYTLLQDHVRKTRRSTIWQRTGSGWKILFHQGTIIQDA